MCSARLSLHDGTLCAATIATMFLFAVGVINISAKKKEKKRSSAVKMSDLSLDEMIACCQCLTTNKKLGKTLKDSQDFAMHSVFLMM